MKWWEARGRSGTVRRRNDERLPADERRKQRQHVLVGQGLVGWDVVTVDDRHTIETVGNLESADDVRHGRAFGNLESNPITGGPIGKIPRQGSEKVNLDLHFTLACVSARQSIEATRRRSPGRIRPEPSRPFQRMMSADATP